MAHRQVIVELRYSKGLAESAFAAVPAAEKTLDTGTVPKIAGVKFDESYAPTSLPRLTPRTAMDVPYVSGEMFDVALEPEESTYIVRAEAAEEKLEALAESRAVVGVYADVQIEPTIICPSSPPLGTHTDVERLLCVPQLHGAGMDGSGVLVAIVDTGFNVAYLASRGKPITLDVARSWVPDSGLVPGDAPVSHGTSHGTMCAFDVAITAPKATFLDIQLLRSTATGPTPMSGLLSDAIQAYGHLCDVMRAPQRPGENRSMVVNNSWGMFHPEWDFPVGDPGNYSDNPNHPFNRIVGTLERLGADILFAAGNCGANCADGRCRGVTTNAIYGANGHPSVLTIAGVDVSKTRVGYSTQGPGRLSRFKPDLSGYTHFQGSGVYSADGGTSAATPVVAGVVAAVRTRRPYSPGNPFVAPGALRAVMRLTAEDLGSAGFDFDHGFGAVSGCRLVRLFGRPESVPSESPPPIPVPRRPRTARMPIGPERVPQPAAPCTPEPDASQVNAQAEGLAELFKATWQAGYNEGRRASGNESANAGGSGSCGCGDTP